MVWRLLSSLCEDHTMTPEQVLVVEDNADIRETMDLLLQDAGYSVRQAINGRDAVDQLLRGSCSPTVILLDMQMPIMNGRQFMVELRKWPAFDSISVILCSANLDINALAAELGVSGYLTKPVDYHELIQMIGELNSRALAASLLSSGPQESAQSVLRSRPAQ